MVVHIFLCVTEPLPFWGKVGLIVLPGAAYMMLLSVFRKPGAGIWLLFPMLILGAFQLVLLYLFGNSIIAVDMFLNVLTTNSGEALELLGKLMPAIIGVIVLYLPGLIWGVRSIRMKTTLSKSYRMKVFCLSGVIFLVGLGTIPLAQLQDEDYRARLDIWPNNIFYNIKIARDVWIKTAKYHETSEGFTFEAVSERPDSIPEVYVLVIGETNRALGWELYGYPRETNPGLKQAEDLICFTDLLTQSNTTHKSVPIILSGAAAEDYEVIYKQRSLVTAFKEAGFKTAFYSNQRPNRSFIDYFAYEADTTVFLKEAKDHDFNPYDRELLSMLDQSLCQGDRKLLIVLHMYGSHFNYYERYPDEDAFFKPDYVESVKPSQRDILINAYDNSTREADLLLSGVIKRLEALNIPAAMLYLSDHGEDLIDDRRQLFLHASPLPSYYQVHVPGILWFSNEYKSLWPEYHRNALRNRQKPIASNMAFHTMLSVGGIETPYRIDSLSPVSDQFTVTKRYYLNDHNLPIPLEKVGFKPEDIEMFKQMGIDFPEVKKQPARPTEK